MLRNIHIKYVRTPSDSQKLSGTFFTREELKNSSGKKVGFAD